MFIKVYGDTNKTSAQYDIQMTPNTRFFPNGQWTCIYLPGDPNKNSYYSAIPLSQVIKAVAIFMAEGKKTEQPSSLFSNSNSNEDCVTRLLDLTGDTPKITELIRSESDPETYLERSFSPIFRPALPRPIGNPAPRAPT